MAFGRTTPALPVADVLAACAFYADRLGFTVGHREEGFARLLRDDAEVQLWLAGDTTWSDRRDLAQRPVRSGAESFLAGTASCRVRVDDAAEVHREMAAAGVLHPLHLDEPTTTSWGTREVHVLDLDGNLLTFHEEVDAEP